ncbi:MAG: 1-deoxy-D-xylulose-5-phosphate synthase [Candidatus Aureabacteria bacterium]|nr:1-deoxy-D-xylulose-5-phosphate synthase [Candidatus Auribacterota bacterium]
MEKLLKKIKEPRDIKKLDVESLPVLCQQIRERIIEVISQTGGHLASSLGVVELTVALHYVFDSPRDKIIWDVGHQCYSHKILTGRNSRLETLRKFGGLSGFLKMEESPHDVFGAGHASTSLSAALGFAAARDINHDDYDVIAVIGDASLTGGLAFEALNNASQVTKKLIVILNDNEMSISRNVGALSGYLNKIITSPTYNKFKREIEDLIKKIPTIGPNVFRSVRKLEESIKNIIVPGVVFEEMGFNYYGPADGHDVVGLVKTMQNIKKINHQPLIFHVLTKKGKGYSFAENQPEGYHGIKPFNVSCGLGSDECHSKTYSEMFSEAIIEEAEKNKKIIAISAAMETGTGLKQFHEKFPDRFFDVGIAEEHAVTFAAGLAAAGYRPVVAVYSTFLQRAYDQIIHDVALQNLPVVFCIDRAGIVGDDGPTHHGTFDISYLRHVPNIVLCQPADGLSFKEMIHLGLLSDGPFAVRYPRGFLPKENIPGREGVKTGQSLIVKKGKDGAVFALGQEVWTALAAARRLEKEKKKSLAVIDARFVKPLDEKLVMQVLQKYSRVMTIEDGVVAGGFGSALLELSAMKKIKRCHLVPLGLPDIFIEHGSIPELKRKYKLDEDGVFEKFKEFFCSGEKEKE